jgi:hypothetical protein
MIFFFKLSPRHGLLYIAIAAAEPGSSEATTRP